MAGPCLVEVEAVEQIRELTLKMSTNCSTIDKGSVLGLVQRRVGVGRNSRVIKESRGPLEVGHSIYSRNAAPWMKIRQGSLGL
ncbi:hypothetical protein MGYG_06922 [Nannizzia gypsea CBS 118893]|uniref:Uncharacterized protein n=1 Tax=Arthroderma gypseum (strain ATCC MYA-4604 / CBS 118893) TaxID=535722 RepID=E4V1K8_ARTGP|nr:hypothetical protein MGYG_06922 [Nannizzia gypsea CBS 118893]EFR03923.1 hypothetical protein MGYG_06922 [Nannizzia gypsea CBS 118893]